MVLNVFPKGFFTWGWIPAAGFAFGWYLDIMETHRLTLYRDKSALYGRVLKEGEKPSWP